MNTVLAVVITTTTLTVAQPVVVSKPPIPINAEKNLPLLKAKLEQKWPDYKKPEYIAAQVEQETCISLKHSKCWTQYAGLKTDRELGFGFGQLTIAYNKDGSVRFNAFEDVKKLDKDLKNWAFENRLDSSNSMLALVIKDKFEYGAVSGASTELDRSAFTFAAYNGGRGGVLQDRRLCKATPGCNSSIWFKNVEQTSYKQKVSVAGYGKSFFQINREYVSNVLNVRSPKYAPYF